MINFATSYDVTGMGPRFMPPPPEVTTFFPYPPNTFPMMCEGPFPITNCTPTYVPPTNFPPCPHPNYVPPTNCMNNCTNNCTNAFTTCNITMTNVVTTTYNTTVNSGGN